MPNGGLYRAKVVDAADPEGLLRVRVEVPDVLGVGNPSNWAWPAVPNQAGNTAPPVGSPVWVAFEGEDTNRPVWIGTWMPVTYVNTPIPPQNYILSGGTNVYGLTTNTMYASEVTGDTFARYLAQANGTLKWGPGNVTPGRTSPGGFQFTPYAAPSYQEAQNNVLDSFVAAGEFSIRYTAGKFYGFLFNTYTDASVLSSDSEIAVIGLNYVDRNITQLWSFWGLPRITAPSLTINSLGGFFSNPGIVTKTGSAAPTGITITNMISYQGGFSSTSGNTVTNSYDFYSAPTHNATGTQAAHFYASVMGGSGALTSVYGFYAAKQNRAGITNAWAFYSVDAGDSNLFAGPTQSHLHMFAAGYGIIPTTPLSTWNPQYLTVGANGTSPNAASIMWGDNTGWKLNLGPNVTSTFTTRFSFYDQGRLDILIGTSGTVGLNIQGTSGQSGALTQWQNSTPSILAQMTAAGALRFGSGADVGIDRVLANSLPYLRVLGASVTSDAASSGVFRFSAGSGNGVYFDFQSSGDAGWNSGTQGGRLQLGGVNSSLGSVARIFYGSDSASAVGSMTIGRHSSTVGSGAFVTVATFDSSGNFNLPGTATGMQITSVGKIITTLTNNTTDHITIRNTGALDQTLQLGMDSADAAGRITANYGMKFFVSALALSSAYFQFRMPASPTQNFIEWQSSSGTALVKILSGGSVNIIPTSTSANSLLVNSPSGMVTDLVDFQLAGTSKMKINSGGRVVITPGIDVTAPTSGPAIDVSMPASATAMGIRINDPGGASSLITTGGFLISSGSGGSPSLNQQFTWSSTNVGQFNMGGLGPTTSALIHFGPNATTTTVPVAIWGASGQTAALEEFRDNNGNVLNKVNAAAQMEQERIMIFMGLAA